VKTFSFFVQFGLSQNKFDLTKKRFYKSTNSAIFHEFIAFDPSTQKALKLKSVPGGEAKEIASQH
jgi:hypothetical protein